MRLTALAAAPIVAASLVIAPHTTDVAVPRATTTIEPQTLAVELTSSALQINSARTTLTRTAAAATPQADFTVSQLRNAVGYVAITAALIGLTPVWYAAFPITLPATVGVLYFAMVAISCISACGVGIDPVNALKLGIETWALGPVNLIRSQLKGIVPQSSSATATPNATRTTSLSTPPLTARHAREANQSLADSPRKAKSGRTPSAEAKAKSLHTSIDKKRTAGTGRSTDKH